MSNHSEQKALITLTADVKEHNSRGSLNAAASPLFILGLPRSFTSVICAMIGQHPQMYGVPELHLFGAETLAERRLQCRRAKFPMNHGLLRVVAQLYFGEQSERTVRLAEGWLRRRSHFTTGFLLEQLIETIQPRILVDKSPSIVRHSEFMERAFRMFPDARFLHLVRHPRGYGKSVMRLLEAAEKNAAGPRWFDNLVTRLPSNRGGSHQKCELDSQLSWYQRNLGICEFLKSVSAEQQMRVCGEDFLGDPDHHLREIAAWLGLRTDSEVIERMKHPELSPYANFGPTNARGGNDPSFLRNPVLRQTEVERESLEGPLSWRAEGFLPKVKRLARRFGYQ